MTLTLAAVAVAGGLGSVVRNEVTGRCALRSEAGRAIGTAAVNLLGTALLALLLALGNAGLVTERVLLVVGVGFCGGLTTFSTWMVEAVRALRHHERGPTIVLSVEVVGQLAGGLLLAAVITAVV